MYSYSQNEIDDFVNECTRRNISEYDFLINGRDVDDLLNRPLNDTSITITKGNISKSYKPFEFPGKVCVDIASGFFD